MTTERTSNTERGLLIGTKAPLLNTTDVFEKKINFTELFIVVISLELFLMLMQKSLRNTMFSENQLIMI
jgi:hypothetical protein